MFNLFGKKTEAVKSTYPKVVEAIHNEFNIAGDNLLKEAKDIIANIRIDNEDKVNNLKKIGFGSTKEVTETEIEIKKRNQKEELAKTLEYFSFTYPMYKFITQDMALNICQKYNLVLGDVEQYTGFVPDKNLKQIQKFYESENELNTSYTRHSRHMFSGTHFISRSEYEKEIEREKTRNELSREISHFIERYEYFNKGRTSLKIAAPLKDMKQEGYKLKGRIFTKEVPDPVVLAPIKYGNVGLYCIVSAWGDEASDPIVVNEVNN